MWPRLITIVLGVIIYFMLYQIIQFIFDIEPVRRGQLIGLGDLPNRAIQAGSLVIKIFIKSEPIIPPLLKIFLGILGILAIFSVLRLSKNKDPNKTAFLKLIFIVSLIVIAIFGIIGVSLPLKEWWPTPRVLSSTGIFWAGILALAYKNLGGEGKNINTHYVSGNYSGFCGNQQSYFYRSIKSKYA